MSSASISVSMRFLMWFDRHILKAYKLCLYRRIAFKKWIRPAEVSNNSHGPQIIQDRALISSCKLEATDDSSRVVTSHEVFRTQRGRLRNRAQSTLGARQYRSNNQPKYYSCTVNALPSLYL
jgi:hypothetical protein